MFEMLKKTFPDQEWFSLSKEVYPFFQNHWEVLFPGVNSGNWYCSIKFQCSKPTGRRKYKIAFLTIATSLNQALLCLGKKVPSSRTFTKIKDSGGPLILVKRRMSSKNHYR